MTLYLADSLTDHGKTFVRIKAASTIRNTCPHEQRGWLRSGGSGYFQLGKTAPEAPTVDMNA